MERVLIVGGGNVAYALCRVLSSIDSINFLGFVARDSNVVEKFTSEFNIKGYQNLLEAPTADIYIVAVSDDATNKVVSTIKNCDAIVCHTSGNVSILPSENCARFYPLQTFTKGVAVDFSKITIFVEANSPIVEKRLLQLAQNVAKCGVVIDGEILSKIHLAATFANNFTNHIWRCSQQILDECGVDMSTLFPLMEEGLRKVFECRGSIHTLQSGVAVRGDIKSIEKHRERLSGSLLEIYDSITNNIIKENEQF